MSLRHNLTAQMLCGVVLGVIAGWLLRGQDLSDLSAIGKMIIHWIKLVAGPFLFFTILVSLMEVSIGWSRGLRLLGIALVNTAAALLIAMGLARLLLWDQRWPEGVEKIAQASPATDVSIGLQSWLKTFMPGSFFEPIVKNEIMLIALMALIIGIAARFAFAESQPETLRQWTKSLENIRALLAKILHWITRLTPFAVFAVLAGAIAQYGFSIFLTLAPFVVAVILGFVLQIGGVYGFWIFAVAKMRPLFFWKESKEAILYSLGVNSSLATLPLTLKSLKRMGVSDASASLGAGVATNLNNDGIVLYEAMAVYFTAIVVGTPMDFPHMVMAALVCIVAAVGITGIPDAGFISLTVVIGILNLPTELLPLLLSVDWILARLRSAVNVTSDMTLSIALDAVEGRKF